MLHESPETDQAFLNRAYFSALRSAAAKSIPDACATFGVDVEFAAQVAAMTQGEIENLALGHRVLFVPAIEPNQFLTMTGMSNAKDRHIFSRLHPKKDLKKN